ncbi:hypothetical protein QCA50_015150 [Cerrena zonata]|uniref:Uncharacterized protein n=1 Tax=Cerrena zonata TaxID=2478898 RepID=A0AAW0FJC0_9APHY
MLSLFNREKQQEKSLRKQLIKESNFITQMSAEIRDKIPEQTDHPLLNKVMREGPTLAEGGDSLLERLDDLSALEKPCKKLELKTLKRDATRYSVDVTTWSQHAKKSLRLQDLGHLNMTMSPTQSGATTRNNSASTSSSTINETYVHPVKYWDWALVDKINASVKTRPANLTSDRTNELGSDVQ